MARARVTTVQQEAAIHRCVALGITAPKQVYRSLEMEGLLEGEHWVSEKTVARRIREFTPHDDSEPWSLADTEPNEAARILDILAIRVSPPYARWPTRAEAQWFARVRTACPDIPSSWALALAGMYREATSPGTAWPEAEVQYLDMVLALQPWASENHLHRWVYAVQCAAARHEPPEILRWALSELVDVDLLMELTKVVDNPRILKAWA
jgi:hypothetical protein